MNHDGPNGRYHAGAHGHEKFRREDVVQCHQAVHQPNNNILFYKRRGVHELSMNHSEAEPPKVHTDSIDMLISYSLPQLGDGY